MKSPSFWEEDVKEDGLYFVLRASLRFSPQRSKFGVKLNFVQLKFLFALINFLEEIYKLLKD